MSRSASQEAATGLKEAFRKADVNKDGFISRQELEKIFRSLCPWTDIEFDALFAGADKNRDDKLSYDEFVDWIMTSGAQNSDNVQTRLRKVVKAAEAAGMDWMLDFSEFDSDGDGCLTLREFRQALEKLGVNAFETEAMEVFNAQDWSHDGTLSIQEFNEFLQGKKVGLEESALPDTEATFITAGAGSTKGHLAARAGTCMLVEDF